MKIPRLETKDLVTITDLTRREIMDIFLLTARLKRDAARGKHHNLLTRKSLAMIFEKSSTRTRVSFEVGISHLGGHALFLDGNDIQLRRGESIVDTARVLSRYVDGIMIRTYSHENVAELARNASVPVINGLSDTFHPCQALADFFTIHEIEKKFDGITLAYVGDGNNVANSLIECAAILGVDVCVASPDEYAPDPGVVDNARALAAATGAKIFITRDPAEAVQNADYVYTDVWISMGEEKDAARKKKALAGYRISKELIARCRKRCRIMHCLPAHRGEEIDAEIMDSDRSIIFDQAENRMHVQKAIMCALMSARRYH